MGNSQFITIGLIAVFFIAISIFFIDNGFFTGGKKKSNEDEDEVLDDIEEKESTSIFYMYNHNSEKDWLKWINSQGIEIKEKAARLLQAHLEGPAKQWGYVTLEALECIKELEGVSLDQVVANFFEKCSKHWHEYKSIPNYYYKAAETLIETNPKLALSCFKNEVLKRGTSQGSLERRRAIIDNLPELKEHSVDLVVEILTNPMETYGTKVYALRKCEKYNDKTRSLIHLKALEKIVEKYKTSRQEMKTEETHFVQDLIEECVKNIGKFEFFKVINEASHSERFHRFVIKQAIKTLNSPNKVQGKYDLFAMCNLKDNFQHDIKRTIGKIHQLDPAEINSIVLQETTKNVSKNELIYGDNNKLKLPIPTIMAREYEEFKSIFFQNIDEHDYVTSEKIYGGVLITGDEPLEKLYFARALAKEKSWNFACIDVSKINNKTNYDKACEIYNNLRKPYLLYLINPHVLFERDGSDESILREKFVQMLTIQALDTKSFLAGDILATNEQIANSSITDKLSTLRTKFFPQTIEINKKPDNFKITIIEEYLKNISSSRFENRREMSNQLFESGKHMSHIEFCFYVIKSLKTMLLIFGKDCDLSAISQLENNFYKQNDHDDEATEENSQDEITKIELTDTALES
jgi:hypothetical protein